MVRTELRVPVVTYAGVFVPACSAGHGSLESEVVDGISWSIVARSESNLSERFYKNLALRRSECRERDDCRFRVPNPTDGRIRCVESSSPKTGY